MDSSNLLSVVVLVAAAAAVAILLLRFMRSRQGGTVKPPPGPGAPPLATGLEEGDYLDSSHIGGPILPGGDPSQSDAAARAAAALRNVKRN